MYTIPRIRSKWKLRIRILVKIEYQTNRESFTFSIGGKAASTRWLAVFFLSTLQSSWLSHTFICNDHPCIETVNFESAVIVCIVYYVSASGLSCNLLVKKTSMSVCLFTVIAICCSSFMNKYYFPCSYTCYSFSFSTFCLFIFLKLF